jgi:hypothetical protein
VFEKDGWDKLSGFVNTLVSLELVEVDETFLRALITRHSFVKLNVVMGMHVQDFVAAVHLST